MPDPAERFIAAAVRPLEDNPELEIAARNELAGSISKASGTGGDSLDEAAASLERTDRARKGKWRRIGLYVLTGLIFAAAVVGSIYTIRLALPIATNLGIFSGTAIPLKAPARRIDHGLNPQQKLLLLGDTTKSSKSGRIKALWDSDPGNPAYFADYVAAYLSDHSALPPDCLETAEKIDPDNSWFQIMAAAIATEAAFDTGLHATSISPGGVKVRAIKDPAKMEEALRLLHDAAQKKRFESYQLELLKQRIPLLPKPTDTLDQLVPIAYLSGLATPNLRLRSLGNLVAAEAIQLGKDKDVGGFKRLLADWEGFVGSYSHSDNNYLVDVLVLTVVTRSPLKAFHEAAVELGMTEEAARLKDLDDRLEAWRSANKKRQDPNQDITLRSGLLAGIINIPALSKQRANSPLITEEMIRPGRLADHALASRLMSSVFLTIFSLMFLATGLYRFRGSALTRRLSLRMSSLTGSKDRMWIIGAGVILPLLYYLAIYRLTPLGGRAWSLKASAFVVPCGQAAALLVLMILLPVLVARRRLTRRAGAAGLSSGRSWPGWLAAGCGAAALPLSGLALSVPDSSKIVFVASGILLGIFLLYGLVISGRALFGRRPALLRRMTLSRMLMPAYASAALLMAAAIPLYHTEEKHWIAEDRLMEISAEAPSPYRYEYEVAMALRQEFIEVLEGKN